MLGLANGAGHAKHALKADGRLHSFPQQKQLLRVDVVNAFVEING